MNGKKLLIVILVIAIIAIVAAAVVVFINKKDSKETKTEEKVEVYTIAVNTEGQGDITYGEKEEDLIFDEDEPYQSAVIGAKSNRKYYIEAKPKAGWKFVKWTKSGEEYAIEAKIVVEPKEDMELIAVFEIDETVKTVEVTFSLTDGIPDTIKQIVSGTTINEPKEPTLEGKTFDGWYADKELTTKFDFSKPITENIMIYAKWK